MDFQTVLAVNLMAISALSLALGLVQRRRELASFAAVNALVILVGGYALWRLPQEAGGLVSLLFVPLVAAPLGLGAMQGRLTRAGRLDAAARCADLVAFFHPTPAMRLSAALARANAIQDPKEKARALAGLAEQAPAEHVAAIEARMLADNGEWGKVLDLALDPENARALSGYRLRALGETGRIEELMRDYARSADSTPLEQIMSAWLFVLAFAGRTRETAALARMARLDGDAVIYWTAVAQRHAGDHPAARAEFALLASSPGDTPTALAARRQLGREWPAPVALSQRAQEIVEGVAARVSAESARHAKGWSLPPVTLALLAVNAAAFVAEFALGGAQDVETLVALGALWPPLALHGQAWRVLTAAFLHYGALHFGLNMLMLALFGRDLEHEVGAARTLATYLGGALFSSGFVLALMASGMVGYGLYVGASGAIFALFGVVGALRIRDWLRHRASLDAFRVNALGFAVLVQIAADFLLPMSSLAAHLSGLGFGLVVGIFIRPARTLEPGR